jgi:predicted RNase H-like nuclease
MSYYVGVDRCRGSWLAARLTTSGRSKSWRVDWELSRSFTDVVSSDADAVGVDIPIGLAGQGWRQADLQARTVLPGWARSRVFLTPPRAVLEAASGSDNATLQALSRSLTGSGVSRQALALGPAILEVDAALQGDVRLAAVTVEVHPELSFAAMTDAGALPGKKSAAGIGLRIQALITAWSIDVVGLLATAPAGAGVDDCLDALAAAWSARRHHLGAAHTWPSAPRVGGTRMAITA